MLKELERNQIRVMAPSIFAEHKADSTSSIYRQYPTSRVLDLMDKEDWKPVVVREQTVRDENRRGFQKHLIRFRQATDIRLMTERRMEINQEVMEIVLTNSHDGKSSYCISAGIFRLVCLNGAVVGNEMYNLRVRHTGNDPKEVIKASMDIVDKFPQIKNRIAEMKKIMLSDREAEVYAKSAYLLKWDDIARERIVTDDKGVERKVKSTVFNPSELLRTRRTEDREPTIWNTYNKVQENIMKGLPNRIRTNNGMRQTRGIKSINEDLKINKSLWVLADEMAKIKAGK